MSKTEIKEGVYPLTAEEFKQSEKITSQDVLAVINEADVEVDQFAPPPVSAGGFLQKGM